MEGQHKQPLRKILESALASKRGSNELMNAIVELQVTMNALLAKLDADGALNDADYASTLEVDVIE
jgi:hypothetical protein